MIRKSLVILFIAGLFLLPLWASIEGKIEGRVVDKERNPLEKVKVTIISLKVSSRKFELQTNKDGKFTQVGLSPDYYQVNLRKPGFMPYSTEVRVRIAESTKIEVTLEKASEFAERNISDADKLFLKGNKWSEEKKYAGAAEAYKEAIKLSSSNWGYYFNLGLVYKKMDKKEDALSAFKKAVELNSQSYSANKEMGEALAKNGRYEEAKKYYQLAIELSPDDPDAIYNFGVVLTNLGDNEGALQSFLKAVAIKKDYADAYFQIGTIYIGRNNSEEAVKNLEKFLELAPEHEKASIASQLLDYLKKQ